MRKIVVLGLLALAACESPTEKAARICNGSAQYVECYRSVFAAAEAEDEAQQQRAATALMIMGVGMAGVANAYQPLPPPPRIVTTNCYRTPTGMQCSTF